MILYFKEASLRDLLKKVIGFSCSSLFFCNSTTTIVCSDAKEEIIKSLVKSGLIKTKAYACLTRSKDCLASTFHLISLYFLSMFVIFMSSSAIFGINLLKTNIFPIKD